MIISRHAGSDLHEFGGALWQVLICGPGHRNAAVI
jgi:hypothetical protein